MHVPVSSAPSLLKEFAQRHAIDILSSCAVSNAAGVVSSEIPGAMSSGVPGIGGVPEVPNSRDPRNQTLVGYRLLTQNV